MLDNRYVERQVEKDYYPQGEDVQKQIASRRRSGGLWRWTFLAATIVAIIILLILLITIINQSFGLVVEQVEIPEETLVTEFNKQRIARASNIVETGEDDQALAEGIANDRLGAGFFGYTFYDANRDTLMALSLDGVEPSEASVISGEYPAIRPLYIYSSEQIATENEAVGAFILYYLNHLEEIVPETGYFAADVDALREQAANIAAALGIEHLPTINPADYSGEINIVGSSTVFPITQAVADRFIVDGFQGEINIDSTGTGGGFRAYCFEVEDYDIVNASRPVDAFESEACNAHDRPLFGLQVATDAVVAAVSGQNEFATNVSREELEHLFTDAVNWSDVNASWPNEEIARFVPTADSGTMDFFVQSVFDEQSLAGLPYDGLVAIFANNVTTGRCRAVEREQRFYSGFLVCDDPESFSTACAGDNPPTGCASDPRTHDQVEQMIQAEVVKPEILKSWFLFPSIIDRREIVAEAAAEYPNADLKWRTWINLNFITSPQSSQPELAGVRTAILGSLWVVGIAILVSFPLGVGAAIYLEEYANTETRLARIIQTNINNLAGVPSIIYGMLGLALFVRALEPLTSGAALGLVSETTANGRTILSAGLTLGLLGLPIIIINAQEAVRAVPSSLREASLGLGATKWQTIWNHVLPNALPGILTGTILTMSRVVGETAPLVVVGASTFITSDPTGPFSKFTTLPAQIFQWTTRPQDTFRNLAGAAIIILLVVLILLNATAIYMRNRFSRQLA